MLAGVGHKLQKFFTSVSKIVTQRRQRKLAKLAELEKKERKAIVESLARKLEEAHAECEHDEKNSVVLVLSLKEIIFMERNLYAWIRHFKESKIFAASSRR